LVKISDQVASLWLYALPETNVSPVIIKKSALIEAERNAGSEGEVQVYG